MCGRPELSQAHMLSTINIYLARAFCWSSFALNAAVSYMIDAMTTGVDLEPYQARLFITRWGRELSHWLYAWQVTGSQACTLHVVWRPESEPGILLSATAEGLKESGQQETARKASIGGSMPLTC